MKKFYFACAVLLAFSATANNKVVYGEDNRYELAGSPFAFLGKSVASMVSTFQIEDGEKEAKISRYQTLESYRGRKTCDDMKFRKQPTIASCSGFLIADDLLVTAGHCVLKRGQKVKNETNFQCLTSNWIFGYDKATKKKGGSLTFSKDDVYRCAKIVEAEWSYFRDYAVIKLDRKTVGKEPVKIAADENEYSVDNGIFVVGNPSGLPTKIAPGAAVKKNDTSTTFTTNLDTFAGNSGSAIFNEKGEAIGILVSGEQDYYFDTERQCVRVNYCSDVDGDCSGSPRKARGETGTKLTIIKHILETL